MSPLEDKAAQLSRDEIVELLVSQQELTESNALDDADVLRIETHPAKDAHLLTPRLWKQHFATNPLRSHIDRWRE